MATVVIAPSNVVNFPEGGGHFWVYMQYAQGLRRLGCDVYWLEGFRSRGDEGQDAAALATFCRRMEPYGLGEKIILYRVPGPHEYLGVTRAEAEAVFRRLRPVFPEPAHAMI